MIDVLIDLAREDLFLYTLVVALPSAGLGMLFLGFAQLLFGEQEPPRPSSPAHSGRKAGRVRNDAGEADGGGFFLALLAVLFIGLKLTGYVTWSWLWVLAPLWIPFVIGLVALICVAFWALVIDR